MINRLVFTSSQTQYHTRKSNILPKILSFSDEHNFRSIRGGNFEFIIENKKVRKQKNKNSIKKAIKKNRKNFLFFLITFLVEFLFLVFFCFLTFLISFMDSYLSNGISDEYSLLQKHFLDQEKLVFQIITLLEMYFFYK